MANIKVSLSVNQVDVKLISTTVEVEAVSKIKINVKI